MSCVNQNDDLMKDRSFARPAKIYIKNKSWHIVKNVTDPDQVCSTSYQDIIQAAFEK